MNSGGCSVRMSFTCLSSSACCATPGATMQAATKTTRTKSRVIVFMQQAGIFALKDAPRSCPILRGRSLPLADYKSDSLGSWRNIASVTLKIPLEGRRAGASLCKCLITTARIHNAQEAAQTSGGIKGVGAIPNPAGAVQRRGEAKFRRVRKSSAQ
jgi:hypothetical protein